MRPSEAGDRPSLHWAASTFPRTTTCVTKARPGGSRHRMRTSEPVSPREATHAERPHRRSRRSDPPPSRCRAAGRRAGLRTAGTSALEVARTALDGQGGLAGLVLGDKSSGTRGLGPARRARLRASVELALRAARDALARAARSPRRGRARLPAPGTRGSRERGVRGTVPRQPAPPARRRGAVPRHARADQRLPARGRQGRVGLQRGGGDLRAQPPLGCGRALARRRAPHRVAQVRLGADRRAGARPLRRCRAQVVSFAERGLL